MKKNIFCLYCLMLCVWPVLASAAEIDDLLNRLDAVIKDRPHCIVEKKKRLQELKLRLYPGLPDEERFRQLGLPPDDERNYTADNLLQFRTDSLLVTFTFIRAVPAEHRPGGRRRHRGVCPAGHRSLLRQELTKTAKSGGAHELPRFLSAGNMVYLL